MAQANSADSSETLIQRAGYRLAGVVERWMPSPFLFVLILSYVTFVLGMVIEGTGPSEMVMHWFDGFWLFLTFAMQMALILLTGYMVAYHPKVNGAVVRLTHIPRTSGQAVMLVGVFAMVMAWVHWGLGLILGAIIAREMGKTAHQKGIDIHYPLLCVAGYMGLGLTWHWGLSASASLLLATPGNVFIEQGIVDGVVSTANTIFSPYALILVALSIAFAALLLYLLDPPEGMSNGITEYVAKEKLFESATDGGETSGIEQKVSEPQASELKNSEPTVPAEKIDNSRLIGGGIALTGVAVTIYTLATQGIQAWNLNLVNFAFLFGGISLYMNPMAYRERFDEAADAAGGIILLFPFFAGIQGMMNGSGLSATFADLLISVSTPQTFPVFAWMTGAVVNLFIPSGGGEWLVIGPAIVGAAQDMGVSVGQATVAYSVGDAHTNLLNPLWAVPLIAITQIKAREMFGYAIAMLIGLIPFLALVLYFLPFWA
ncbi:MULTISPECIES: short-chain fatty acid transporter [unclassified Haladaptatus]|uniref:short-chain fatty acid transporter n=1 Tax=unclassified Haladaptatus TaxID=2622732 RepID=UPI0023E7BB93|nr:MULTISPECIES: TIGR00366 family protein [unclassified Haladaptatus]